MASSSSTESAKRFFTHESTITTPSDPSWKLIRAVPPRDYAPWLVVVSTPFDKTNEDRKDTGWTPERIKGWEEQQMQRYQQSLTKHDSLTYLVVYDGEVVGLGDLTLVPIKQGVWNVGIILNEAVRRKGLGALTMRVLTQIGWMLVDETGGGRVECGTMKDNIPFRGLMKKMGMEELDEVVEVAGRGVVAECVYHFHKNGWEEVEMKVEFGQEL